MLSLNTFAEYGGLTGTSNTITLPTALNNDVCILAGFDASTTISSVTSANLTWAQVPNTGQLPTFGTASTQSDLWYAVNNSGGTLTNEVLTITHSSANFFNSYKVFSITGANSSSPFDSTPVDNTGTDPLTISTTAANTLIFGNFPNGNSPTPGAGWTQLGTTTGSHLVEYAIFSTPQTALSINLSGGAGQSNGCNGVAVKAASGPAVQPIGNSRGMFIFP